jgi:hypothetical protein
VFIHAVLESFAAVDEDYGDFVGVETAEVIVGVYVNFLPVESGVALKFSQTFFDDLAQVASLAGVDHDLSGLVH